MSLEFNQTFTSAADVRFSSFLNENFKHCTAIDMKYSLEKALMCIFSVDRKGKKKSVKLR